LSKKIQAAVNGRAHDAIGQAFADALQAEMPAAQSDGGNRLAGTPECAARHCGLGYKRIMSARCCAWQIQNGNDRTYKPTPLRSRLGHYF
jgi:hypothetical protein